MREEKEKRMLRLEVGNVSKTKKRGENRERKEKRKGCT